MNYQDNRRSAEGEGQRFWPLRHDSTAGLNQVIPSASDAAGKLEMATNEFRPRAIRTRDVIEHWDDDFDLTTLDIPQVELADGEEGRVGNGLSIAVPPTIKRRQTVVLASVCLLREWSRSVKELKVLWAQATSAGMLDGQHAHIWRQVVAIITLADETAEARAAAPSSLLPSLLNLDMDAPDRELLLPTSVSRPEPKSDVSPSNSPTQRAVVVQPTSHYLRQRTTFSLGDVSCQPSPALPLHGEPALQGAPQEMIVSVTRPRKGSEAIAQSIIEALRIRESVVDPLLLWRPALHARITLFDTATLRYMVPSVQALARGAEDVLRCAGGVGPPELRS